MKLSTQKIASTANGATTRGQKTEEGKHTSTPVLPHCLLSKSVVPSIESQEAFDALLTRRLSSAAQSRKWSPANGVSVASMRSKSAACRMPSPGALSDLAFRPESLPIRRYQGHRSHRRAAQIPSLSKKRKMTKRT